MFTSEELRRWLPVHIVIWGADGGGSMFDQRMTAKVLRDADVLPHLDGGRAARRGVLMHEMVHLDGKKMSKHLGNVVDPDAMLERVGADTRAARGAVRGRADEHPHAGPTRRCSTATAGCTTSGSTRCRGWRAPGPCASPIRRRAPSSCAAGWTTGTASRCGASPRTCRGSRRTARRAT